MSENKTVKYHIPEQGIYLYARTSDKFCQANTTTL